MPCKGICIRHAIKTQVGYIRYNNGQKRCQVCSRFVIMPGLFCLCCGYRLRTKSHNKRCSEKYRAREEIKKKAIIAATNTYLLSNIV